MTVASTPRHAGPFLGNGVTTNFPFTFKCFATTDVAVYFTNVSGVQSLLTTGYTVAINADQEASPGGSVTYPSAGSPLATGEQLDMLGNQPYTQPTSITNAGRFEPSVIEKAIDYLAIQIQQQAALINRAMLVPLSETAGAIPPAALRKNKTQVFDDDGNVTVAATSADVQLQVDQSLANKNLAQAWATQTATEVVAGQGFGAKKYANDANTSAAAALASQTAAAASANSALIQSGVYVDEPTGRAAVADGVAFKVQGSGDIAALEYRRVNAGTVSTLIATYPSFSFVDAAYHERFFAAQARSFNDKRQRWTQLQRPKALVYIATGQSNNAKVNAVVTTTAVSTDALRPTGGTNVGDLQFYASNQGWTPHWSEFATAVTLNEFTTESTLSGAALMLQGLFPRIYAFSAAYGGNGILQIAGDADRTSLFAAVFRLCDLARAAGYEPVVAYSFVDGEANMTGFQQMDEATFKSTLQDYWRLLQQVAAMAMDKPDYDAPIVIHTLNQLATATFSQGIDNALVSAARETPNAILASPCPQWPVNADLIHNSGPGFRKRSEQDGYLLRNFFSTQKQETGVFLIDAIRTTTSLKLTFSQDVTIDTSIGLGTSLNANGFAGIEYTYDGTNLVKITGAAAVGRVITCTLLADPGVHAGTEQVRIGCQINPGAGVWPQQSSGASIRATNDPGFVSPFDGTTTLLYAPSHYRAVR